MDLACKSIMKHAKKTATVTKCEIIIQNVKNCDDTRLINYEFLLFDVD